MYHSPDTKYIDFSEAVLKRLQQAMLQTQLETFSVMTNLSTSTQELHEHQLPQHW